MGKFSSKDITLLSIFLALALIIGLVEQSIPFNFTVPGVKLGLSNAVILIAIYLFAFYKSLTLVVLKCTMLMLVTGNAPAFWYSLCGSVLSFLVMWLLIRLLGKKISPIGVSVAGAVFHNIGQILAAAVILHSLGVAIYLPVLIVSGVITGAFVGIAVNFAIPVVSNIARRH